MAKLSLTDFATLRTESAVTVINANNALIETALENTLSRDGTSPNEMEANLDMNSNRIINLPDAVNDAEPVTKGYFDEQLDELNEAITEAEGLILATEDMAESGTGIGIMTVTRTSQFFDAEEWNLLGDYFGYNGSGDVGIYMQDALEFQEEERLAGRKHKAIRLPAKGSSYHFETSAKPPDGAIPWLKGDGSYQPSFDPNSTEIAATQITSDQQLVPIDGTSSVADGHRMNGAIIEDICFEGGFDPVASGVSFPYRPLPTDPGLVFGMRLAFNFRAKLDNPYARVVIRNCRFQNIIILPVWLQGFKGGVIMDNVMAYMTRDFGILNCYGVRINNLHTYHGRDSHFSITRQTRDVIVTNNYSFGQYGPVYRISGITANENDGGDPPLPVTATVSGSSYTAGSLLTMIKHDGETFLNDESEVDYVFWSNDDYETGDTCGVRVVELLTSTTATVLALTAIPASMQNLPCGSYKEYNVGPENIKLIGNTAEFSGGSSIFLTGGARHGKIIGNHLVGAGFGLDPLKYSAARGSGTTINVETPGNFSTTAGQNIVVFPGRRGSTDDYYIGQVTGISGNDLTVTPSMSMAKTGTLWKCIVEDNTSSIYGWGQARAAGPNVYFEGWTIRDNTVLDPHGRHIELGANTQGSIRNCIIKDNFLQTNYPTRVMSSQKGILIEEYDGMPQTNVFISGNHGTIGTAGSTHGVHNILVDTSSELPHLGPNYIVADDEYLIEEDATSTDMTELAEPIRVFSNNSPDVYMSHMDILDLVQGTASFGANILTLVATANTYAAQSGDTATSIVFPTGTTAGTIAYVRNTSTTQTITFTNDATKIMCPNAVDFRLGPRESCMLVRVSSTITQVLGGPSVVRAKGTVTIANPAVSGTFAHGLLAAPNIADVDVKPTNADAAATDWYVSVDATNVTVTCNPSPAASGTWSVSAMLGV